MAALQEKIGPEVLLGTDLDLKVSKAFGAYTEGQDIPTPLTLVVAPGGLITATFPPSSGSDWPKVDDVMRAVQSASQP